MERRKLLIYLTQISKNSIFQKIIFACTFLGVHFFCIVFQLYLISWLYLTTKSTFFTSLSSGVFKIQFNSFDMFVQNCIFLYIKLHVFYISINIWRNNNAMTPLWLPIVQQSSSFSASSSNNCRNIICRAHIYVHIYILMAPTCGQVPCRMSPLRLMSNHLWAYSSKRNPLIQQVRRRCVQHWQLIEQSAANVAQQHT